MNDQELREFEREYNVKQINGNIDDHFHRNFLGHQHLQKENKTSLTATIKQVVEIEAFNTGSKKMEKSVALIFNKNKPFILNKTNFASIEKMTGSKNAEDWKGIELTLYIDNNVKVGREKVSALRVRKAIMVSNKKYYCEDCNDEIISTYKISAEDYVIRSQKANGKIICLKCYTKQQIKGEQNG